VPGFVGPDTLFIAMSFSGNTEETVSGLRLARERGAKIVAVTTGGTVGQLAREWNFPLVEFQYAAQPRAALGYLFLPVLSIMSRLGFIDVSEDDLSESVEIVQRVTRQWSADRPTGENLAKQLAQDFHGKVAVIYAAEHLAAVSRRWKTQMNENAKNWAFFEEFPELNHNTIVGYEHPSRFNDLVQLVVLTGSGYSRRIQVRVDVTQQLLDRYHVPYRRVDAPGTSSLAQMFSAIMLGDFVTYYLALLNGSDPTVIEPIDILKHALAQTTG
jgi:glucose/mannose-6-phosphate isomerase